MKAILPITPGSSLFNNKQKGAMAMPEITRFYGIIIRMYFLPKEHEPSHIHAKYGEYEGSISIDTCEMISGNLPKNAQKLVKDWVEKYKEDLQKMWDEQKVHKLPPLL